MQGDRTATRWFVLSLRPQRATLSTYLGRIRPMDAARVSTSIPPWSKEALPGRCGVRARNATESPDPDGPELAGHACLEHGDAVTGGVVVGGVILPCDRVASA